MTGILQSLLGSISSAAAVVTDAYFNLVTLLLPGNGTNGAQNNTFLDSSSNNFTITRNGNTTQGTFSPFSQTGWSNYFDGTADYLTAAGANLALGTGDFTIEFWFYANAYSATADSSLMFDSRSGNDTSGFFIGPVFNNTQTLHVGQNTTPFITASTTYSLNTWIHCAVVRSSGTITLYQNGTSVGSASNTSNNTATTNYIGGGWWQPTGAGQMFNGYLSNLRISNAARYTGNFTPSTSPFTSDANTRLLTCQSNRFRDSSSNGYPITLFGTVSVQAFSPFAPTAAYDAATVGGSGYFDGTGDYLTGATGLSSSTSMSTFTVEGWFYPTTFANTIWIVGDMEPTTSLAVLAVRAGTNGDIVLYWYDGAVKTCTSTTFMKLNQWNWFAVVVNANAISIYVNSTTPGQTGTTTLTNRTQSSNFAVGQNNNSASPNGYIGSLRWSNGIARTISSIPTAPYTSDADTRLLLNFTNAGITDATAKNDLETVGNAQISTTQSKFGGSSMYFDGTGDLLALPNNELFNLSSGDFTIEGWFYANSTTSNGALVSKMNYNGTNWTGFAVFQFNQTIVFYHANAGSINNITTGNVITSTGTWYHIAVVKSGTATNNTKIYIDGVQQAQGTPSIGNASKPLTVGGTNSTYGWDTARELNCYIDDLRITRYARYTSAFTPPTAPFALQ